MARFSARFRRHLDGWQLGVVAVGVALSAACLALPRPVAPRELPLPVVDRRGAREERHEIQRRLRDAVAHPLPFTVRATGEAFREFGLAEARGNGREAGAREAVFTRRFSEARRRYGDAPLLSLSAVQTTLFVQAVQAFAASGGSSKTRELDELGGTFVELALSSRWIEDGRFVMEPDALAALFRVRWTGLAGVLETYPFMPSLNDWRLYYRALLSHPEVAPRAEGARERPEVLDGYVTALAVRDPEYPATLAHGILAHWAGRYDRAEELFVLQMQEHPTGEWRLRTQNYLLAARRQIASPLEVRQGPR